MSYTVKQSDLTYEQAQAERTAGQLLTAVAHQQNPQERGRLLSLAFWHAGRAEAYEALATDLEHKRSNRR